MTFENKVAVITGAGQGIGKRIAEKLAEKGASMVLCDQNADTVRRTGAAIAGETGAKIIHRQTDVADQKQIKALIDSAMENFQRIDIFVNNAAICEVTPIEDITWEAWQRMLNVNLAGMFFCCQAVMPIMKKQRSGRILNMASIAGKMGGVAAGIHYSASKAGVICVTKVLAKALGSYGVTVNAIAPGPVDTTMIDDFSEEARKITIDQSPVGRVGTTDDIAAGALYLLSDEARHVTGETLNINGGLLMD
jgi:3-oxoacyl-[acyl-carrier protein] reductase